MKPLNKNIRIGNSQYKAQIVSVNVNGFTRTYVYLFVITDLPLNSKSKAYNNKLHDILKNEVDGIIQTNNIDKKLLTVKYLKPHI